ARAAAWGDLGTTTERGIAAIQRRLPSRAIALEYALLPNQLVVWRITRSSVHCHVVRVSRDSIASLLARFGEQSNAGPGTAGSAAAQLFDVLIGRIRRELVDAQALMIVPDRELSGLAFAALWDQISKQYLVEKLPI